MNKNSQSMIPGASLASTIKVLAGLGPLGQKVLKQNGISEIDPKKNYPSIIRLKIFDEVRERFGDDFFKLLGDILFHIIVVQTPDAEEMNESDNRENNTIESSIQ